MNTEFGILLANNSLSNVFKMRTNFSKLICKELELHSFQEVIGIYLYTH